MTRFSIPLLSIVFAIGCSTKFDDNDGNPEGKDSDADADADADADSDADSDTDSDADADADNCEDGPPPGTVGTLSIPCEYTPAPSGTAFSPKIEWAMTHAFTDPTDGSSFGAYTFESFGEDLDGAPLALNSVFQSPAVAQFTDDNGDGFINQQDTPDIAVNMGNEFDAYYGTGARFSALRIISGDGTEVHASILTETYGDAEVYAPYLFAGLAAADVDGDGWTEVATVVRRQSDGACFPAMYEVTDAESTIIRLQAVASGSIACVSHAPALGDVDGDGHVNAIFGDRVYLAETLSLLWAGGEGAGWWYYDAYGATERYTEDEGYWNSGYHSFAYDIDHDGSTLEIVAGRTIYKSNGDVYCQLTDGGDTAWDGYPAVADIVGDDGEPEIVLSGNHWVSIYDGTPNAAGNCEIIDSITNKPEDDPLMSGLPSHPDCNEDKSAFGGQPTIADFTGDGEKEIGVAGSCWYSVYKLDEDEILSRYALAQTKDWSSASTGSTVFDFNGDEISEVVFSDEEAVYVWQLDESEPKPWDRLVELLRDENHKSWTIHEYPVVADVDGDGKAEIIAVNSELPSDEDSSVGSGHYGIYVIGAADDDWVSARKVWNQHAYYVTNIADDYTVGYAAPNYAPHSAEDFNSFRQQAPGSFGANAATNLYPVAEACSEDSGGLTIWVQAANEGNFITARAELIIALYGENADGRTLIATQPLPWTIDPGELTKAVAFELPEATWSAYDTLIAVVDEPDASSPIWGGSHECDEDDNEVEIDLSGF